MDRKAYYGPPDSTSKINSNRVVVAIRCSSRFDSLKSR